MTLTSSNMEEGFPCQIQRHELGFIIVIIVIVIMVVIVSNEVMISGDRMVIGSVLIRE